jgi:hypothetical protein
MKLFQCACVCVWGGNFSFNSASCSLNRKTSPDGRERKRQSVSVCSLCNNNFPPLPSVHIFHLFFPIPDFAREKISRNERKFHVRHFPHMRRHFPSLLFRLECFGIDGVAWNALLPFFVYENEKYWKFERVLIQNISFYVLFDSNLLASVHQLISSLTTTRKNSNKQKKLNCAH